MSRQQRNKFTFFAFVHLRSQFTKKAQTKSRTVRLTSRAHTLKIEYFISFYVILETSEREEQITEKVRLYLVIFTVDAYSSQYFTSNLYKISIIPSLAIATNIARTLHTGSRHLSISGFAWQIAESFLRLTEFCWMVISLNAAIINHTLDLLFQLIVSHKFTAQSS